MEMEKGEFHVQYDEDYWERDLKEPSPEKEPVFAGLRILIIERGIGSVQRKIIKTQIENQGGKIEKSLTRYTTHIIATTYLNALESLRMSRIPDNVSVHSIAWLTESLQKGKIPSHGSDFKLSAPIDPKTMYQKSTGTQSWMDLVPNCTAHGLQAIVKYVRKEGPHKGKAFFCCPLKDGRCNFFEWVTLHHSQAPVKRKQKKESLAHKQIVMAPPEIHEAKKQLQELRENKLKRSNSNLIESPKKKELPNKIESGDEFSPKKKQKIKYSETSVSMDKHQEKQNKLKMPPVAHCTTRLSF